MRFDKIYVNTSEKEKPGNKDKKVISDDAFALGDIIQKLIDKIEQTRSCLTR